MIFSNYFIYLNFSQSLPNLTTKSQTRQISWDGGSSTLESQHIINVLCLAVGEWNEVSDVKGKLNGNNGINEERFENEI